MNKYPNSLRLLCGLFLIFAIGLSSTPLEAQINIGRKVKRKVNDRVDRKVDDAIDDALDGLFKKKKAEAEETAEAEDVEVTTNENGEVVIDSDGENVIVSVEEDDSEPVEVEPVEQTGRWTMEVSEYKKGKLKKDMPARITYHIDTYKFASEIHAANEDVDEVISIYDRRDRKVTMKSVKDGEKTAFITKMPRIKVGVSKKAVQEGEFTVKPTGQSKSIEGYLCKEYKIDSSDEITYAWITEELIFDIRAMNDLVQVKDQNGMMTDYSNVYNITGFMLEAHTEIKGKDETRDFFVRDIHVGDVDPEIFSLDGYEITDMSSMGSMFGK